MGCARGVRSGGCSMGHANLVAPGGARSWRYPRGAAVSEQTRIAHLLHGFSWGTMHHAGAQHRSARSMLLSLGTVSIPCARHRVKGGGRCTQGSGGARHSRAFNSLAVSLSPLRSSRRVSRVSRVSALSTTRARHRGERCPVWDGSARPVEQEEQRAISVSVERNAPWAAELIAL
jgi:hypothetical protein